MHKKIPQKRYILIVVVLVLVGLVFVSGAARADAIGDFLHYEDILQEWLGGQITAGQSHYQEGEVLPHYAQFTDLAGGTPYYFYIYMDYYWSTNDACGFDKLYQYDDTIRLHTIQPAGLPTPNYFPPPNNGPQFSTLGDFGGEGYLKYGGDALTDIILTEGAFTGAYPADQQANILVQFTTSGITTTVHPSVEFYWGQHIAVGDIGTTDNCPELSVGAADWSGGGLRTKLWDEDGDNLHPTLCTSYPYVDCWFDLPTANAINIMPGAIRPPTFDGFKWFDSNWDGSWESGEAKLPGWLIYMQECPDYPDLTTCSPLDPVVQEYTDSDGYYSLFVPLDENDAVDGYFRVCEVLDTQIPKWLATHPTTLADPGTRNVCHDPEHIVDGWAPTLTRNFGNYYGTTAVTVSDFTANPDNDYKVAVLVEWQTTEQTDTLGFNLYRSRYDDGSKRKLLTYLDVNLDCEIECDYEYLDKQVGRGKPYYYWLEAVYSNGSTGDFGPIEGIVPKRSK